MGDVTRALVGLEDFEVTGAVERAGVLEVGQFHRSVHGSGHDDRC